MFAVRKRLSLWSPVFLHIRVAHAKAGSVSLKSASRQAFDLYLSSLVIKAVERESNQADLYLVAKEQEALKRLGEGTSVSFRLPFESLWYAGEIVQVSP